MDYHHRLLAAVSVSIVLMLSMFRTVHGLKCVQCGYKPPDAFEMSKIVVLKEHKSDSYKDFRAYADTKRKEVEKYTKDAGCPAELPEATPCKAEEVFCIKMNYNAKTSRFCYDVPVIENCEKDGDHNSCSYMCNTTGCNSAERATTKRHILFTILVTSIYGVLYYYP